jgi:hypothetical protein
LPFGFDDIDDVAKDPWLCLRKVSSQPFEKQFDGGRVGPGWSALNDAFMKELSASIKPADPGAIE